jgi:chromosome segregation ATPase
MVPRAVQDAGYTALGLGVLALQQVQTRQRELAKRVNDELNSAGRHAQAVLAEAKAKAAPVTSLLDALPRLPGPVGAVIDLGRARLAQALRPAS